MTVKRFTINMEDECIDDMKNEIFIDFNDRIDFNQLCELLNELHEENQLLKKHIRELYKNVKFDIDNEIEVYPKVLLRGIVNILKIIGDVE